MQKGAGPRNQGPRTDVLMKKNEGRESCDTAPLTPALYRTITFYTKYGTKEKR
jgi:hypothetical protein